MMKRFTITFVLLLLLICNSLLAQDTTVDQESSLATPTEVVTQDTLIKDVNHPSELNKISDIGRVGPKTLRIPRCNHAQTEQKSQYPQYIRFAFHRLPPFRQINTMTATVFVIGRAAASSLKSRHSATTC